MAPVAASGLGGSMSRLLVLWDGVVPAHADVCDLEHGGSGQLALSGLGHWWRPGAKLVIGVTVSVRHSYRGVCSGLRDRGCHVGC